ncbi:MAG: hypothetical protein LC793_07675 [Thermomicrobia bacterium]|nr:hypothetical protein [Thermomicrobia bacterium]
MTIRIASRNLVGAVALLILVACTTGARSVGADETPIPIIPTPTTTGIITPLLGSPPVPTVIPSPPPAPGGLAFVRTITNADDGGTIRITVGDRIALALTAPTGFDPWEVALPDAQVLMPVPNPAAAAVRGVTLRAFLAVGPGQSAQGVTLRAFLAVGPGQSAIMAQDHMHCVSGQPCAGAIRAFRMTIVVVP